MSVPAEQLPAAQIVEIPIGALTLGDDFRLDDDPDQLCALAVSVEQLGVLEPLLVRQADLGGWEVIAGRRRLAAARQAGLATVPCIVRSCSQQLADDITLAENTHRRRLSPVEEALAYQRMRRAGLTQAEIGRRAGYSQTHVSTILTILALPGSVRDRIHRGELSYATALRPHGKQGGRQGGGPGRGPHGDDDDDSILISHWRRRHEYDHFLGYEPEHWLDVQAVCTACHANREMLRRRTSGSALAPGAA